MSPQPKKREKNYEFIDTINIKIVNFDSWSYCTDSEKYNIKRDYLKINHRRKGRFLKKYRKQNIFH